MSKGCFERKQIVEMEKRMEVAPKELLITVTSELMGQAPCFGTKRQEGSDNVVVVERFQTKAPIKRVARSTKIRAYLKAPTDMQSPKAMLR